MAFDSIPQVEAVEGARLMSIPDAVDMRLRIYGNWYPIPGVEARPGYDPNLPWVSASPDVNSPEWARARKVRKALHMAIDRNLLVETLLGGRGHTNMPLSGYTNFVCTFWKDGTGRNSTRRGPGSCWPKPDTPTGLPSP
jgi:ABC-type transport system substrate-binding protein